MLFSEFACSRNVLTPELAAWPSGICSPPLQIGRCCLYNVQFACIMGGGIAHSRWKVKRARFIAVIMLCGRHSSPAHFHSYCTALHCTALHCTALHCRYMIAMDHGLLCNVHRLISSQVYYLPKKCRGLSLCGGLESCAQYCHSAVATADATCNAVTFIFMAESESVPMAP
jgi:hypothetical protein